MSSVEITNFRPTAEVNLIDLNALFDLRLPNGTFLRNVGIADDGTWIRFSGIPDDTPWREEIISAAGYWMRRHRRDHENAEAAARLVAPQPTRLLTVRG
ncbi:hypothetical protein WMC41_09770 [Shinella yambaruensis]|uniref:hypothetical protein n=1 Tax=Shinella yambaruensis TaxID=415996 RepID=UPI003D7A1F6F